MRIKDEYAITKITNDIDFYMLIQDYIKHGGNELARIVGGYFIEKNKLYDMLKYLRDKGVLKYKSMHFGAVNDKIYNISSTIMFLIIKP